MTEQPKVKDHGSDLIQALLSGPAETPKWFCPETIRAYAYLAEHSQDGISLRELLACVHTSRSQLFRTFRQDLGLSPKQVLTRLRVEKAKSLLDDRRVLITEVATSSGFPDLRAFERAFKKWVGCTPNEYRRQGLSKPKASGE